jgi:hypothetical protein
MDGIHTDDDGINDIVMEKIADFYQQTAEAKYGKLEWG